MTAQELADYFEVSKRTVLRDIDTLSAAKIPVYTKQGKGGGISLMEGFVLNKTVLTEDEQNQMLLALQSLSATKYIGTGDILSKLGSLFQKPDIDWIEVDFSRWGQGTNDNQRFELLKRAILAKNVIKFQYVSSYGDTSIRKVYPLKLIFKSKAWYLQAFDRKKNDYRTFRINRMLNVKTTDETFAGGEYAPPPIEYSQIPTNSLVTLELVFSPHVAYRVYDEFDEGSIYRADNGSLHVFTKLPDDNWLHGFLLSFGNDVTILQPAKIRDRFIKR